MKFLAKLKDSEPLRLYVYPVLVVLLGVAVTRGVVDQSVADMLLPLVGLLIGVPAVEIARAKVTPQAKLPDIVASGAQIAMSQARDEVADRFGEQGTQVLDAVSKTVEGYIGRHRKS